MIAAINNLADVKSFTKQLVSEGVNVHPDDDFSTYMHLQNNQPTFSAEKAEQLNALMQRCFYVADRDGFDIYEEMLKVSLEETKLNQLIPTP